MKTQKVKLGFIALLLAILLCSLCTACLSVAPTIAYADVTSIM